MNWTPSLIASIVRGLPDTPRLGVLSRDTVQADHFRHCGCTMDQAMLSEAIEVGRVG